MIDWPSILYDYLRTGRLFIGKPNEAIRRAVQSGPWWVVRMY